MIVSSYEEISGNREKLRYLTMRYRNYRTIALRVKFYNTGEEKSYKNIFFKDFTVDTNLYFSKIKNYLYFNYSTFEKKEVIVEDVKREKWCDVYNYGMIDILKGEILIHIKREPEYSYNEIEFAKDDYNEDLLFKIDSMLFFRKHKEKKFKVMDFSGDIKEYKVNDDKRKRIWKDRLSRIQGINELHVKKSFHVFNYKENKKYRYLKYKGFPRGKVSIYDKTLVRIVEFDPETLEENIINELDAGLGVLDSNLDSDKILLLSSSANYSPYCKMYHVDINKNKIERLQFEDTERFNQKYMKNIIFGEIVNRKSYSYSKGFIHSYDIMNNFKHETIDLSKY